MGRLGVPKSFSNKKPSNIRKLLFSICFKTYGNNLSFPFYPNYCIEFYSHDPDPAKVEYDATELFFGCREVIVWCCRGAVGRAYRKGNMENGNR